MQATSDTWVELLNAGAALEARATINGVVFTDIGAPEIQRGAMGDALSIGNVVSASLRLALRTSAAIATAAAVAVECRFNDGATASEWLPQGTFYISQRARDPVTGVLTLQCYDALLKANAVWTPSSGSWPRDMAAIVTELAGLLGVQVDSRSVIPTGTVYALSEPAEGTTIRDVLGLIAQAGAGNWIMTPEGKLRLVPVVDTSVLPRDAPTVQGITGSLQAEASRTITGVRNTWEELETLTGDDSDIVVDTALPPLIVAEVAQALISVEYQAFSLTGGVYDPAIEIGDYLKAAQNEVFSALYRESATFGPAFRGDLAAPPVGEVTDEYPYIGAKAKALTLAKAYAREAVAELDGDLDQQEIFDRLTDNGAAQGMVLLNGQLYVNATYVNSGIINGDLVRAKKLVILDSDNNVIAQYDRTIILGNEDDAHALMTPKSFQLVDGSDTVYMSAGDARDENDNLTRTYTGDGTTFKFLLMPYPESNNITGISKVTVDGVAAYGVVGYESGGAYLLIANAAPASGSTVQVWFGYSQPIVHYTLGVRQEGALLGDFSVAEGTDNAATGDNSHAEGANNTASGSASHAEGDGNTAMGDNSHAEGNGNIARGPSCHAEGVGTAAGRTSGKVGAHAEGNSTQAEGDYSHAEGNHTLAYGDYSHAEGDGTVAGSNGQHVVGSYNIGDYNDEYLEIVGNGSGANSRSNARTLDWDGNEYIAGALSVGDAETTLANLGALPKAGGTMTGNLIVGSGGSIYARANTPSLYLQDTDGSPAGGIYCYASGSHQMLLRSFHTGDDNYENYNLPLPDASGNNSNYNVVTTKNRSDVLLTKSVDATTSAHGNLSLGLLYTAGVPVAFNVKTAGGTCVYAIIGRYNTSDTGSWGAKIINELDTNGVAVLANTRVIGTLYYIPLT